MSGKQPSPGGEEPITQLLQNWKRGDAESVGKVVAGLYSELHRMAGQALSSERTGHTLQPTALIHELFLRLRAASPPDCCSRTHFFALAANTLRRILIDHARTRCAQRRGGKQIRVPLELAEVGVACSYDDLLLIDEALTRLEQADQRAARVTELRFFAGLEEKDIAAELGVSEITVKRDWKFARAWLAAYLKEDAVTPARRAAPSQ